MPAAHATGSARRWSERRMGATIVGTNRLMCEPRVRRPPDAAVDLDSLVDEVGYGSFPASDPPSWWAAPPQSAVAAAVSAEGAPPPTPARARSAARARGPA